MRTADIAIFWFGCGLIVGALISHWLWRLKIREKALTGFRLPLGGRLYDIRESK